MTSSDPANTNNRIENSTIVGASYLLTQTYATTDNKFDASNVFTNCVVDGVGQYVYAGNPSPTIQYSNFSDSFAMPTGPGNTSEIPGFVDPDLGDYRLRDDSPIRTLGTSLDSVPSDKDGKERTSPYSMGAHENDL